MGYDIVLVFLLLVVEISVLTILVLVIVMVTIIAVAIGSDDCNDCGAIYIYSLVQTKLGVRVDLGVLNYEVRRCRKILQGGGEGGG